jgi:hypothetical protein
VSVFGEDEILCRRRRQKCAGVQICKNVDSNLLKDRRELNPKSLEDIITAQVNSRITETDSTAKRTLMYLFYFPVYNLKVPTNLNINSDSSLLFTQSLAMGRRQTVQVVMAIQF